VSKQADAPNLDKLHVIDDAGNRTYVFPADVRGRFNNLRPWLHALLIIVYVGMPWVTVAGRPAIHIDIPGRHFILFGEVFNAQDFYLAFSLLTGIGFGLIFLSALFGRVWCGWACPQTVFLEGVFRRIERWIEGPHNKRRALMEAPWTTEKIVKRALKHSMYLVVAWLITHTFLAYFISAHELGVMIIEGPAAHPVAFAWGVVPTLLLYFNFWWFREQLCLIICPYGRLQSALQDDDTINVGYDFKRGEPRGKKNDKTAGDCVDCGR
jgi:cytochrome c oxidase accessory protein FixG